MSRLIVDLEMKAKLHNVKDVLEICDDSGHVLGHFIPFVDPRSIKNMEPKISEEEVQRRTRRGGGRELTAILSDLEKRA
jgi:hypothetical protein